MLFIYKILLIHQTIYLNLKVRIAPNYYKVDVSSAIIGCKCLVQLQFIILCHMFNQFYSTCLKFQCNWVSIFISFILTKIQNFDFLIFLSHWIKSDEQIQIDSLG